MIDRKKCIILTILTFVGIKFVTEINLSVYWDLFMKQDRNLILSSSKSKYISFEEECLNNFTFIIDDYYSPMFKEEDFEFLATEEGKQYKKILFYHHISKGNFRFGLGEKPFEAACCKEKRCFATDKRDVFPIEEFDAVMINTRHFSPSEDLPTTRSKHQRWIFVDKEPPVLKIPPEYEGIFNWTMTYRRDSDIYYRYSEIYLKSDFSTKNFSHIEEASSPLHSVMKTKNKLAAWMVSHCKTSSKREDYVKELQKFIPVDIYGKCGPLECGRSDEHKCYRMVEENYKFYLSFENNICVDYITEKFFNILTYHIIPVVRGGGDYARVAPPYSYIDASDFDSPKDLAEYLIYLDGNNTAYMEYFKWKKDYVALPSSWFTQAISYCDLCEKLHTDTQHKVYSNLTNWLIEKAKCK